MNRHLTMLSLALAATMLVTGAKAQPWRGTSGRQNFYDLRNDFYQYWKGKDSTRRAKGWKIFKRWEWFWSPRVYPTGEFPDFAQLSKETHAWQSAGHASPVSANWTSLGPSQSPGGYAGLGRINCVRVSPATPNTIWVGSASGGLWKSTDAGVTWSSNTDALPSLGVTDIAFHPTDQTVMFMATGDGDAGDTYSVGILKSTDGGTSWNPTGFVWNVTQQSVINRLLMNPGAPQVMLAAGNNIFRSTDGGESWTAVASGRFMDMEYKPGDPSVVYASTSSGQVYRSTDGGGSWLHLSSGLPSSAGRAALGVSPADPTVAYALVAASNSGFLGMYRTSNSGDTWTRMSDSPNILGWAADGSDDGGQGWYDLAVAVSPVNAQEVYIGGINEWKSTNGGASWTRITMWYNDNTTAVIHADQHDLFFVPGSTMLYGGNDGGVYRTTNGGTTWQWLGAGLRVTQFYRFGVSATNPNRVIAGAQDNGTKLMNGGSWNDVLGGDGMEAIVDYTNADVMYGSLYNGAFYRSVNGGVSFTQIGPGNIPESGAWVTPLVIHPTGPDTLFAGYVNVWRTTNRGDAWEQVSSFTGNPLELLAVAPSDPAVLYAGRPGSLWRTTTGGASWTSLPLPAGAGALTYLAVHPSVPSTIWVTSSGYSAGNKVYRSDNGGDSWTNISGGLPNVPANCIVVERNSPERIYVGTDIGIFYRDIVTPQWQDYNTGLPNTIVNELEIQYTTHKLLAATYGRGVWTSDVVPTEGRLIAALPPSVDFGRQEVGVAGDTAQVEISCFGTDTLVITSFQLPAAGFSFVDVPPVPVRIPPGGSASLRAAFMPSAHGDIADSIVCVSNATNDAMFRIALNGRGVVIGRAAPGEMFASSGSPASALFKVNTATGVATLLGGQGVPEIHGLAVQPETEELFGVFSTSAGTSVYRISSAHGDALPVTTVGVPNLRAIAFRARDTLYGATVGGRLYRINPTTWDTSGIGTAPGIVYSGLSFSPIDGRLWASVRPVLSGRDRIYTVDVLTGAATLVGATGDNAVTPSIAFGPTGILYGLKGTGAQPNALVRIDTASGSGTTIGATGVAGLSAITMRTDSILSGVGHDGVAEIPDRFVLEQNYPNPFNPLTQIRYGLPGASQVKLVVYDILGAVVATLADGREAAGFHEVVWDGRSSRGGRVASGVYIYRLEAAMADTPSRAFVQIRKMVLVQ